jgi:hypothetical protein
MTSTAGFLARRSFPFLVFLMDRHSGYYNEDNTMVLYRTFSPRKFALMSVQARTDSGEGRVSVSTSAFLITYFMFHGQSQISSGLGPFVLISNSSPADTTTHCRAALSSIT